MENRKKTEKHSNFSFINIREKWKKMKKGKKMEKAEKFMKSYIAIN